MGMIFDIQRGCTDDGPGIRTTVFLKGCPLRCQWCHNPESWSMAPQTYVNSDKTIGYEAAAEKVMETVLLDAAFYAASGGGLTISGGEPLMQPDFTLELLELAVQKGIHTCLETSGYAPWETLRRLLPAVNLFLYDIKATPDHHQQLTHVDQQQILENLHRLMQEDAAVLLRCPIVPGFNDTPAHFSFLLGLLEQYPQLLGLQMMPYHNLGAGKARKLGMACPLDLSNPSREQVAQWRQALGCDENNFRASKRERI